MAKYLVLFTPEAIDPSDDSLRDTKLDTMMFAYPGETYWTYDNVADAKKDIKDNDYVLGKDCLIVRVLK